MKTRAYHPIQKLLLAGVLAGAFVSACSADIIYQDTFARDSAGPLNGSAPTVDNTGGAATWTAGTGCSSSGTNAIFNSNIAGEWPGSALLPLDWTNTPDPKAQVDVQFVQAGDWITLQFGDASYWGSPGMPAVLKLYGNGNVEVCQGPGWDGAFIKASFPNAGTALGWNRLRIEFSNTVGVANFYVNGTLLTNITVDTATGWNTGVGFNYNCGANVYLTNLLVTFGSEATFGPSISEQPKGETVFVGDPASLNLTVGGSLPLHYTWCKDNTPIPGPNANTFSLPAAAMSDSGNYTVIITNDYGAITSDVARLDVHLEAQSPLAQINFDDITNNLYQFGFTYASDSSANLPVSWGFAPGDGLGSSTGFRLSADGSDFANVSVSYAGFGGGVGLALPRLTTYNLDCYEAYCSARVENLQDGVTNTPGRIALRFYIIDPVTTNAIDVLDVTKAVTYSSNYQAYPFVLNTADYGGAAGLANFAQNLSQVVRVQFEFTLDNFYSDFVNGPGDALVLDDLKLASRHSPAISVSSAGGQAVIHWDDPNLKLQGAAAVTGPYTDITGASSPYSVPANSPYHFFRTNFQPVP